ncbi:RNA 2',3'-cyclic phosphodiesterase [Heyndrickxia acidicola]|uniref:RNA 2',3'-cyclic phosphodiesterase n=1 Tax=Heyndrickxia acidicola TaxID=209389 RepID=A0ABU6MFA9_9BACI|nr:RNA 2',3'-cyclic phosphodiesterase [Heyndrickxia acidicola]MED1203150.1 RNA 2',3'-cyclic phosphodiesterase [Heyndrickxia acidicola]
MTGTHYFFALALPEEIKQYLYEMTKEIRHSFPFKKWVHQEDYHITLAFLGRTEPEKLEDTLECLHSSLSAIASFPLELDHLGIFGKQEAPRILWAGVKESDSLNNLRNQVYNCCLKAGFILDSKPFAPHITLSRKWTEKEPFSSQKLHTIIKEKQLFTGNRVVLYQTHLDRIPKYEEKKVFLLN